MYTGDGPNSSGDPLRAYLKEISGIRPLTREEEQRLAKLGDEESLKTLVVRNLKYTVLVANRYKGLGLSVSDLINEGNIGLIEAAKRFDHKRGVKFITYASWWIKQGILRALAEQAKVVRLPVKQAGLLSKVTKAIESLTRKNQREPALEEVATALGIKKKSLETVMRVYRDYLSLDSPLSAENNDVSFLDIMVSDTAPNVEEDFIRLCLHHDLEKLLTALPPRESAVLRMRYGFDEPPLTLETIGNRLGLTRERIRQLEKSASQKLRTNTNLKVLEDYLR